MTYVICLLISFISCLLFCLAERNLYYATFGHWRYRPPRLLLYGFATFYLVLSLISSMLSFSPILISYGVWLVVTAIAAIITVLCKQYFSARLLPIGGASLALAMLLIALL